MHRYVIKQDYTKYMETTGVVLTCKKFLNWLQQLLKSPVWFVLHIDGKHKLRPRTRGANRTGLSGCRRRLCELGLA